MKWHGIKNALKVPGLEDVVHVSKAGLLDDLVSFLQIQPFRNEEHPVKAVDVLQGECLVGLDARFCFLGVCSEQDRQESAKVLLVYVVRLNVPLKEDDGWDIIPAQNLISLCREKRKLC
jgi:hypothetical protein